MPISKKASDREKAFRAAVERDRQRSDRAVRELASSQAAEKANSQTRSQESTEARIEPFICFVKYRDYKFDIVVHKQRPIRYYQSFAEIRKKIDQIFRVALNKELSSDSYVFEVIDGVSGQSIMVSNNSFCIKHLSVVRIWRKTGQPPPDDTPDQSVSSTVHSDPSPIQSELSPVPQLSPVTPVSSVSPLSQVQPVPPVRKVPPVPTVSPVSPVTQVTQVTPAPTVRPVPQLSEVTPQLMIDPILHFLEIHTLNIISFYLMVDCMDPNIKLKTNSANNWESVYAGAVDKYPNIFEYFTGEKCMDVFNTLLHFYIINYDRLRMGLSPRLQKRFDMLKIVHILDPNKVLVKDMATHVRHIARCDPMIGIYLVKQHQQKFDIFLNVFRREFHPLITYHEIVIYYLDNC